MLEEELSLLQAGDEVLPAGAEQLAEQAARGELQAALSLARLAAECPSLPLRRALCRKIREIPHPESARVALLYLLSQLARLPELSMPLVLDLLESPAWRASIPEPPVSGSPPPPSPPTSLDLDARSLRALFLRSSPEQRRELLQRCLGQDQLRLACQLPLDGDDWQQVWPHLSLELQQQVLLHIPVNLACQALELLQERPEWQSLACSVPEDRAFLGWATPAPSRKPPSGGGESSPPGFALPREKYPSDAAYYDGVDGGLEVQGWSIRVQGQRLEVRDPDGSLRWQVTLGNGPLVCPGDSSPGDYDDLARHDRLFDDLNLGKGYQLSSLSVCAQRLAVATSGGGLRLYDLEQGQLLHEVYAEGAPSLEALPVRLRFSQDGKWLAGVRLGHFFLWGEAGERTLDSLPGEVRGLFFRGSQLWAVVRDGSLYRLDPARGTVTQELKAGGILPALSPDRRWLASYQAEHLRLYGLSDEGLFPLSQLPAPRPLRISFADAGQAVNLRPPDTKKSGSRTALTDLCWRPGHLCLSEITECELAYYRSQSRAHPHPVWDFLVALGEACLDRR